MSSGSPRIGCIGAVRGAHVVRNWQTWGHVRAAAICDLNIELAEREAQAAEDDGFPRPRTFVSVREMLSSGTVDGVVVATPDATHFAVASEVLKTGVACLIEKPMACTSRDAAELCALAKQHDAVCMVGHEFRHAAAVLEAKHLIASGRFGQPRLIVTLDYCGRMGSYWRRREWRDADKPGNNSLTLQKAVHQLDLQMHFAGSRPVKVYASSGQTHFGGDKPVGLTCETCDERDDCLYEAKRVQVNGVPNPRSAKDHLCVFGSDVHLHDHQVVAIDYDNGVRGSYVECFFTPDYRFEQTIICDLGRIELRYLVGEDAMQLRTTWIGTTNADELRPEVKGSHGGGDFGLGAAFAEAVRSGRAIQPTAEDGFYAVAVAEAVDASAASGQPVMVAALDRRVRGEATAQSI